MVERARCTGCGACAAVCGEGAVTMERDREGFCYPILNAARCTHCGRCERACPIGKAGTGAGERLYLGARAKEADARLAGSSGGMFPLLAAQVLEDGGVVFGAAMGEDGQVRHIGIERPEDIGRIARTKYVQSSLARVWEELPGHLRAGRPVLFCGTPCQAAALRGCFGGDANLLLADLICYGVPSPGIWERYVRFLERRCHGKFQSFFFRDKRGKDNGQTVALTVGGQEYTRPLHQDPFCRSFFYNVNIRPSCFRCPYCTVQRSSDLTLGDFWGIEEVKPGWDDGLGQSAVICHTPAGKRLWSRVQEKTEWFSCREEEVANARQPRLREPVKPSRRRSLYLWFYRWLPFSVWIRFFSR
ncbi:MAG: 4Fe-4S binding protein [Provencibacterium sp.]|jgi:NAD-dependent dihydropyrimidine dehydrogenase PreA subunit|nr:4Fe-4S binding protein [Provencibacterium sp.]